MMRVLWIVNIELPAISEKLGRSPNPLGGWLTGVLNKVIQDPEIHLTIVYPDALCTADFEKGQLSSNVDFVGFKELRTTPANYETLKSVLRRIVAEVSPDLIHIHGTEYMHSCALAEIASHSVPTVLSIQGILTPYYDFFLNGVPGRIRNRITPGSLIRRDFLQYGMLSFKKRIRYEQKAMESVDYIIGRTDWDRAYAGWMAPQAAYRKCNESLRDAFYTQQWDYAQCEKNTLFASQSDSPIKGFHFLLRALALARQQIPDIRLYAVGAEKNPKNLASPGHLNIYQQYIYQLIREKHLEDHVVFLGKLSEQDMVRQYKQANVFVCPSSCENSPNSLGEAMLLGMPCIASDVGGISSLMSSGREGIIYRCDDVSLLAYYLTAMLQDPDTAAEYGRAARARAMVTHDRTANYQTLLCIYREMLERKNGRGTQK